MTMRYAEPSDMEFIQGMVEHPDIKPFVGDSTRAFQPEDYMSEMNQAQAFVFDDYGCIIMERYHDDTLESHVMFLPGHRGKDALNACKEVAMWTFADTPCEEIVTKCPLGNERARGMCQLMGFRETCRDTTYSYHSLPISQWLMSGLVDLEEFVSHCVNGYGYLKALVIYNRVARLMLLEPARLLDGAVAIGESRFIIPK
jgi:hypothetical protein